jgi:hypothetical protein
MIGRLLRVMSRSFRISKIGVLEEQVSELLV